MGKSKYSLEHIKEVALKYTSRKQFALLDCNIYNASIRSGFHKENCEHMPYLCDNQTRALYIFEFSDKSAYIGLTWNYHIRYRTHLSVTKKIIEKTKLFEMKFIELGEWYPQNIAVLKEEELIQKYKSEGWNLLNSAKGGCLGGNRRRWTEAKLIEEALKYKTRSEFAVKGKGAWDRADKIGILDKICSHMPERAVKWTKENLSEEAKKYNYKSEFRKADAKAYCMAWYLGILDEICLHMVKKIKTTHKCRKILRSDGTIFESYKETKLDKQRLRYAIKTQRICDGYSWSYIKEEK